MVTKLIKLIRIAHLSSYFCIMKQKIFFLSFAIFLLLGTGMSAQTSPVKEFILHNGLTVWVAEDHTQPKVFGAVVVRAGGKDCPGTGIAHYFEHIMFKGTDRIGTVDYAAERLWLDSISAEYDKLAKTADPVERLKIQRHINSLSIKAGDYAIPNEFENLISQYGGSRLNAYTSFDETVYHNEFAPQYIVQWCTLNADRLISPVFRLFQGELETVYEEKNMYSDNPLLPAAETAQRFLFRGTPYEAPLIGTTEQLKNPQLSEMRRFFDTYYVGGNMGLILCGDVKADTLLPLLERTFGRIRAGVAPERHRVSLPDWSILPTLKLKLPIPVVKAGGYVFRGPEERNPDRAAFMVMVNLLSNKQQTGLLDSLSRTGRWMAAMPLSYDFGDYTLFGAGFVPKIPFGSLKKADRLFWQQISKLRNGQIAPQALEAAKWELLRTLEKNGEDAIHRSNELVNAYSHQLGSDYPDWLADRLRQVTMEDVERVARTYINDDSVRIKKVFGHYPKDRVSQPGYRPVVPRHAGAHSAYADSLARTKTENIVPRLIDVDKDATCMQLRPLVRLYTAKNPKNDIFSLCLVFRKGKLTDKRLGAVADYMNDIDTRSHTHQQFGEALRAVGAHLQVSATDQAVTVYLEGFDSHFAEAMQLLHEWLSEPKSNEKSFKNLVREMKVAERTSLRDQDAVSDAVLQRVMYGGHSPLIDRLTAHELKNLNGDSLINLFREVTHTQLDVTYCGTLPDSVVSAAVGQTVDLDAVSQPYVPQLRPLVDYNKSQVFFYDNPKARQTTIAVYQSFGPMANESVRNDFSLWGSYFGGGMSSVLFQDIREFRALAYRTGGYALKPILHLFPNATVGYLTCLGTQADKSMQAIGVLDTLYRQMPMRVDNIEGARQGLINQINNGYPAFRSLAPTVAAIRAAGYTRDPNAGLAQALPSLRLINVEGFYRAYVQSRPRVLIIVGNGKTLDKTKLALWGGITQLKKDDIFKK